MHTCYAGHIPFRQICIEGTRAMKHFLHVGDLGHSPFRQVCVEGMRVTKNLVHVRDLGNIPFGYWPMIPRGAIAHWRQLEAVIDSNFEIISSLECCGGLTQVGYKRITDHFFVTTGQEECISKFTLNYQNYEQFKINQHYKYQITAK